MHIVVLAYGPAPVTKRAVNRARKLAGTGQTVTLVGASPPGRDAMANVAGASKIDDLGSAGLRRAFADLGDDDTLLIHDDVILTMRGMMALERARAAGARFAVPYSNDPGMDHFIGALPADKTAEKFLDQAPVPAESKPATQIRPACITASATDLTTLLSEPLPDPYAFVTSEELGFVVAGGALASHASQCVHRLVDPSSDSSPLLVAALIVKNEEEMLPDCIASLSEVCDRVEVCDTGSDDDTVAIAKAAGASVGHTSWENDFGAARNVVLERCRDARYVLWIDADERVVCPDPVATRRYLATYAHEHPAFKVEITNLESDGKELYRFLTVRLFHATGTEFRGALHEAVHLEGDEAPLNGHRLDQLRLDHHGYATEVVADRDKASRNLEIAEAQHEADGDARSAIHLARSLSYAHESPERALELLEEGLAEATDRVTRAQIMGLMGDRLIELSENRRAFDMGVASLELLPGDDTGLGVISAAHTRLGNHEEFLAVGEAQLSASSVKHVMKIDHNRLVFHDRLVAAYAATGQAERAIETAVALLSEEPEALRSWPELVECLSAGYGNAALELLVPVALMDGVGGFLEPIIKTYPSSTVADFCAAYTDRGGQIAETIRVGLLAAGLSGNDTAFEPLADAASNLDPFVRISLADRIADSGRPDLAEKLRAEPVVLKL